MGTKIALADRLSVSASASKILVLSLSFIARNSGHRAREVSLVGCQACVWCRFLAEFVRRGSSLPCSTSKSPFWHCACL